MNILVYGNGWLGRKIADAFGGVVSETDILDLNTVKTEVEASKPDVVVNAAGKCGKPNIDWCELPQNRYVTKAVNTYGPVMLENVCHTQGVKFVHLSSGCLWEWGEDLTEETIPDPPSWYSQTKADAESRLDKSRTLILRPRMPVDASPSPRNLIDKLVGYTNVLNVPNSVTVISDFLDVLKQLIEKDAVGIFNVVNEGAVTGAEVMTMYCELVDPEHCFRAVDMDFLWQEKLVSAGRSNVTLSTDKLRQIGIEMAPAQTRVRECMLKYAKMRSAG